MSVLEDLMLTRVPRPAGLPANPTRSFPLVLVRDLAEVRAFYVDRLGCPITFDLPTYLQVQLTPLGPEGPELCFMVSDNAIPAQGVTLSVPVGDVDVFQTRLDEAGIAIDKRAADQPWGWRSLYVTDPTGLVLDFFHVLSENAEDATG